MISCVNLLFILKYFNVGVILYKTQYGLKPDFYIRKDDELWQKSKTLTLLLLSTQWMLT